MSDENPFKCKHPKCGRSFTKEEHLAQHMMKHDLGLSTQFLNEPEQTPTPTRGLNLGDLGDNLRLPLTSDLTANDGGGESQASQANNSTDAGAQKAVKSMNPFDRAFRAATLKRSQSNASVDSNKTIPVINNLAPQDILRTPNPSLTSLNAAESLGLTSLMQLNPGSSEVSLAGLVPMSPLPSSSALPHKPSILSKTSTITSFLASLGFTGSQEDGEGQSTADILSKACSSNTAANIVNSSPGLTIQTDQNGQPQVLLLHTPQPQSSSQAQQAAQANVLTSGDQSVTMLPLTLNSGSILQNTTTVPSAAAAAAAANISGAQLYVPYLLQENGTMIPLSRLASGGGVLGSDVLESAGNGNKRLDINGSDVNLHDVDVDNHTTIEEDAVTSSTISLADNGSRSASALSEDKAAAPAVPDNKDKIKEAIRRRCATSAADSLSCAPPRKRLSLSAMDGDGSDNNEGNSNRSSASGSSSGAPATFSTQLLGGPIRGRKALELAAKIENTKEDDRKRDQLEKKLLYLERNRAASQRSRDKKKKIMTELRDKNRMTDTRNKQLEQANLRLREEVVYLKSLLLQHIDCPKLPFQIKSGCDFKSDAVSSLILNGDRSQVEVAGSTDFVIRPTTVGDSVVNLVSLQPQHPGSD